MTPLKDHILTQIQDFGLMPISDYMVTCLLHPDLGYYKSGIQIGAKGDFVTAPEISQMFGEVLGLALAQTWLNQGSPPKICLAELGPGRGTLMSDILRATKSMPGFHDACKNNICLVEANPDLRRLQSQTLAGHDLIFCDTYEDLPDMPLYIVANEFFDCLPIRQFRKSDGIWMEQVVAAKDGDLHFALIKRQQTDGAFQIDTDDPRDFIEHMPSAGAIAAGLALRISHHGGAALIIDYGDWDSDGDTLQAVQSHTKLDPLAAPGQSDLTVHVPFSEIANGARVFAKTSGLTPQGVLLERLGITARAQTLAKNLSGLALEHHITAHRRLTHGDEMGTLFKGIAIVPNDAPLPPGFHE